MMLHTFRCFGGEANTFQHIGISTVVTIMLFYKAPSMLPKLYLRSRAPPPKFRYTRQCSGRWALFPRMRGDRYPDIMLGWMGGLRNHFRLLGYVFIGVFLFGGGGRGCKVWWCFLLAQWNLERWGWYAVVERWLLCFSRGSSGFWKGLRCRWFRSHAWEVVWVSEFFYESHGVV